MSWHSWRNRATRTIIVGSLLTLALPWAALADDIANNLDASVDAVAEVMSLNAGGPAGSTTLYVTPSNGDGKNGCNLTGSTALAVSVVSSDPAVATVSPSSVTFASCGDTRSITVTPVAAGAATVSLSQISNTTGGTFNLAPATFSVLVAPPANTAPTIAVTGVTGGASYEIGAVPAAMCAVTDAEDGSSSFAATLSAITGTLAAYGLGTQTAACSYTDGGGLTASAAVTYEIVDTGAPSIADLGPTSLPDGNNGWYRSAVTNRFRAADNAGFPAPLTNPYEFTVSSGTSEGSAVTIHSGAVTDAAGNTNPGITSAAFKIDLSAPAITYVSRTSPNANGWNNSDVTVTWSCADTVSGPVATTVNQVVSTEGANQSVIGTCVDLAGNTASNTQANISIDKTAPTSIAFSGGISSGQSFYYGDVPPAPTCTATDALSGLATCTVSGYSTATGSHTLLATATDKAGNVATAERSYTVLSWTIGGFYQPVDMTSVNSARAGSTVPLKFEVFKGSTELTDTSIVSTFTRQISCSSATSDDIEQYATGGTSLRYDATSGQFVFNWQTPKAAGSCYRVTLTTTDGSSISADFRLK